MTAGIVLGPVVFGVLAPELHAHVFAKDSLPALEGLSQVGLVLFLFIVGAELRAPGATTAAPAYTEPHRPQSTSRHRRCG